MQRKTSLALIAGALLAPACAVRARGSVAIGSQDSSEQELIGNIYAASLQAANIPIARSMRIGDAAHVASALQSGAIDIVPLLVPENDLGQQAAALPRMGVRLLRPSPGDVTPCLVVTEYVAEQYSLLSLSTCAQISRELTLGTTADFARNELPQVQSAYARLNFKQVRTFPEGGQIDALNRGDVDVATTTTTDAQIFEGHLVALEDDRRALQRTRIVPAVRTAVLHRHPAAGRILDRTSGALTNFALRSLNVRLQLLGWEPRTIADDFVRRLRL